MRDFVGIEVRIDDAETDIERFALVDGEYFSPGLPLHTFTNLPSASVRQVQLVLRDRNLEVTDDVTVRFTQQDDANLSLVLQRLCQGVVCQPGSRCWAETCVSDKCIDGTQPECKTDLDGNDIDTCSDDDSCPSTSPCAKSVCFEGACFSDVTQNNCASNESCDVATGCVPAPSDCIQSSDCPSEPCLEAQCYQGRCVHSAAAEGAACSDGLCQFQSDGIACVATSCMDSVKNGNESDVDCGGNCDSCNDGQSCSGFDDCSSGLCALGQCVGDAARCDDGIMNQTESDNDCGGLCAGCSSGQDCNQDTDCQSQRCIGGTCAVPTCGDGTIDFGEACDDDNLSSGDGCDSNCLIENGGSCSAWDQCASGFCATSGSCTAPTCDDGVKNGDELLTDCGGAVSGCRNCVPCDLPGISCSRTLPDGASCTLSSECASGACAGLPTRTCQSVVVSCSNGIEDGDETGADCGGSCPNSCLVYDCSAQTDIPEVECQALLNLYNTAGGSGWTSTPGWFADTNPCTWSGVVCMGGNVDQLSLTEDELDGALPWGLDVLAQIRVLVVSRDVMARTQLGGDIPGDIGAITTLELLDMSSHVFTGNIPEEIGNLTALYSLDLAANNLVGSIPTQIGNLTQLTRLNLQVNNLGGSIPSTFGNLTRVNLLYLSQNSLSGNIPAQLGDMTNLIQFWVRDNNLSGSVPAQIMNLSSLSTLNICNQMGGLTATPAVGSWMRTVTANNWPAGDSC